MNVSIVDEGEKDDTPQTKQKTDKQKERDIWECQYIGGIYNRIIHFFRRIFLFYIPYQERIRE